MTAGSATRYTRVAIALHWVTAAAILALIAVGWIMGDMPKGEAQFATVQLHKSFGILVLLLSVARVAWRLMNPPPPAPPMPALQGAIARGVHIAFYALIILMPLSGWIMVSASPRGIATELFGMVPWPHIPGLADLTPDTKRALHEPLEFVHSKLAWVIIVLLALHVGGALKHHFVDKDGLLARMAPGLFGQAEPPSAPGRGAAIAFGATLLLFILIAGAGYLSRPQGAAPTGETAQTLEATQSGPEAPAWTVDPAKSSLRFRGSYMGRPFEGGFETWSSQIRFDPDRPEAARIRVTVATGSARTGEAYYDENLPQGDWFDAGTFPDAVFEVNEGVFKIGPNEYEATGILTLKGVVHPVRLPFRVDITGTTARATGGASLKRTALGIGRETLTEARNDEEFVSDDVELIIDLTAVRQ
jgi:cytochrome b561